MPCIPTLSLRARLILAILLTTLPLMALIWGGAQRRFARQSRALEQEVQRLTAFVTGDVNHLLDATRQILVAVAGIGANTSPEAGRAILADLARRCPQYVSFGVASPRGESYTSDSSIIRDAAPMDVQLVQRALEARALAVGPLRADAAGGMNLLSIAYCVEGESVHGRPTVAFVTLDLGWLDALLLDERVTGSRSLFPTNMVLNILDRAGTVLTRYPDDGAATGRKLPDTTVLATILKTGEGVADLVGIDGQPRYYAFQSPKAAAGDIVVCTGVLRESALAVARSDMYRSLAGVSVVGGLLLIAAWFGAGLLITRPVAALVEVTQRLRAGELGARTGITRGPREITHLAGAFDRMAEALQGDAAERERMQATIIEYDRQLRSMAVEAALAEERERKQVAAGLHDKAGPLLAACFMKLGRALKLSTTPAVTAVLTESRQLIDQAIGEVRSLTFDLSSPALYTLGLPVAVEELCRDTADHHALEIVFQDQGTPPDLANDRRVVLYRAARELLFNVVKHAEATRVSVTCGGDAEEVFIRVADDGVGFDASDAGRGFSRTGGFGLFNLRERLSHLGGRFAVASTRGSGTCVVVALPVGERGHGKEADHGDDRAAG